MFYKQSYWLIYSNHLFLQGQSLNFMYRHSNVSSSGGCAYAAVVICRNIGIFNNGCVSLANIVLS